MTRAMPGKFKRPSRNAATATSFAALAIAGASPAAAAETNTNPGSFTVRRTGPTTTLLEVTYTVAGTATAGVIVVVTVDGVVVGMATAGADGSWSLTPSAPLVEGMHTAIASVMGGGASAMKAIEGCAWMPRMSVSLSAFAVP